MSSERQLNSGLLFIRLGITAGLLIHALPRLLQGPRAWTVMGREVRFWPAGMPDQFAGLILLVLATLAGLGMLSGYLFRVSAACAAGVYGLYFFNFYAAGHRSLMWYAAAVTWVSVGLLVSGPGRFSLAVSIKSK